MHLFKSTNIDFIGKRRFWYVVSTVITVAGIVFALIRGVEYGIDFAGGTEAQMKFEKVVEIESVRSALDKAGFRGAEVKHYGADESGVLVRVPEGAEGEANAGTKVTQRIQEALASGIQGNKAELLQEQHIGPKIGAELQQKAILAVLFTCIAILIYIAFRFRFVYGLGAIIALIHDVLVAFAFAVIFNGIAPWLNLEMNSNLLAAFLTIVGFSVNDTVIIFDRIREDSKKYKGNDLKTIMNRAINETLPRTIITSGLVLLTLLVLFIWGGEVLRGFAFTMLVGVLTGVYSSVFVASAISYDWIHRKAKGGEDVMALAAGEKKAKKTVAVSAEV
jgi:preprotein translocase subunit SecF